MTGDGPVRLEDGWLLPLSEQQVTRCCLDFAAVRILCENLVEIIIEELFTLTMPDGQVYAVDPSPSGDPTDAAPILRIMRRVIREGTAFDDGTLEVIFEDGARIDVPFGREYEAWHITGGEEGFLLVSLPGGGLG